LDFIAAIPWWVWLFFGLGVYATVIESLKAFYAFGRTLKTPHVSSSAPAPGSFEFLQALSGVINAPVRQGGHAVMLNNGDGFYPSLLEAMASAQHHIHIMTYIWRDGKISDQIFDVLLNRLKDGVDVRIMVDGLGSLMGPRKQFKTFREAGGKMAVFAPLQLSELIHFNHRNHRRAFVIDGRIAFTGGITVDDHWIGDAQDPHHWRDTMIRVTGPMAHTLQSTFVQLWTNVYGEILSGESYYPPDCEETRNDIAHIGIAHSPSTESQSLLHFFWFSLHTACKSIYIANAYFAPDRHIRGELLNKARKGLDVRIMLPGRHTDNMLVRWAGQRFYSKFLRAGIRIYEYQPTMMHAKHMVVDDGFTIIGSANIDNRSVQLNQENALGIADDELAQNVKEVFYRDFERCEEITLERWIKRPLWWRLRERVAVLFMVQY
jgi:cardiolipin synthase A/B